MRIFLSGAAENLREPPHSPLMRYINERLTEYIRLAIWTGIRLRDLLCRPEVLPPSQKRQRKEASDDDCKSDCQNPSSHPCKPGPLHSRGCPKLDLSVKSALSMLKERT